MYIDTLGCWMDVYIHSWWLKMWLSIFGGLSNCPGKKHIYTHLVAEKYYEEIFSATNFILEKCGIQRVSTNINIASSKVIWGTNIVTIAIHWK